MPSPAATPSATPAPSDPPAQTSLSTSPARSLAPDLARGLMLVLIAIANVSWLLWGQEGTVGMTPHVPAHGPLDTAVQAVMTIAVDHRAMPLFAFLFGYGMVQFHRSRLGRGISPQVVRVMLRRRHWAMLLLGLLHAALLFYGDILGAYGIAALLMVWIFFGRRTRTLVIWVCVLAGISAIFALFSILSAIMLTVFAPEGAAAPTTGPAAWGNDTFRDWAYASPYLTGMGLRLLMWGTSLLPSALMAVPLPLLLGWIAARHRLLEEPWRHVRTLRRIMIGGIAIGWLTGLPDALLILGLIPLAPEASWGFATLNTLGGVACGVGYAAAFALLAQRLERRPEVASEVADGGPDRAAMSRQERKALRAERAAQQLALTPAARAVGVPADPAPPAGVTPPLLARVIAAVGQRSLTFYLFQSVVLVPLMASWGLGLGPHLSTTAAIAIAIGVWLLSLPLAWLLHTRGMRGPAEKLLRRMTYGKLDPRGDLPIATASTSS